MRKFKFLIPLAFSLSVLPTISLSTKAEDETKFFTLDSKYNAILNSTPTYKVKNEKVKIAEFTLPETMLYSFNDKYRLVYESYSSKSKNLSDIIYGKLGNRFYLTLYPYNSLLNSIDNSKFKVESDYWKWLKSVEITDMFEDKKTKNSNILEFKTNFNQNAYKTQSKINIDYFNFSFNDITVSASEVYDLLNSNKILFYEDYFSSNNQVASRSDFSWGFMDDFRETLFAMNNLKDEDIDLFLWNSFWGRFPNSRTRIEELRKFYSSYEYMTLGISKFNNIFGNFNSTNELNSLVVNYLSEYYKNNLAEDETINLQKSKINNYKISLSFKVVENKINNKTKSKKLVDLNQNGTVYDFKIQNERDIDLTQNPTINNKILLPILTIYTNDAEIVVENSEKNILKNAYSDFSESFNLVSKYLRNNEISLISENIKEQSLFDANIQAKLNEKINQINSELINLGSKFSIEYEINENSTINVLLSNKNNNLIEKSEYVVKNLPVKINLSEEAIITDINERLVIEANKYVDFNTNTTELIDDVPVVIEQNRTIDNRTIYGGKFLYHAPAKLKFLTIDEDEVLFINEKRIQVYNKKFEEVFDDKRLFIDEALEDTEEIKLLNNYHIEIKKYRANAGNTEENYLYSYIIDIVIDANSLVNTFKYYAWNPEKNKDQAELITEFLTDKDGHILTDEFGAKIANPKYDKEIDKFTGTKKELVWVDLSKNTQILSNLDYYIKTGLPFSTKTLLAKNNNSIVKGFIAEASVLGSGALHTLIGLKNSNSQYRIFKINIDNLANDYFSYEEIDNNYYKDLSLNTSESSYFSTSGLWLFTSHAENSIDNYKLILIDDKLNAQKDKFSNTIISERIKKLWNSNIGMDFYDFLAKEFNFSKEKIESLSYENVLQYFMLFINENHKYNAINNLSSYTYIYPKFKQVPNVYSYQNFVNTYTGTSEKMNSFIADYGLNFAYKEQLIVNSLSVSTNKKFVNLIVGLKNNNSTFNYRLAQSIFRIPIQFIDVNYPKENENDNFNSKVPLREINIDFNSELINNEILTKKMSEIKVNKNWFNNLNINDYNKLIFNTNFEQITNHNVKFRLDIQLKDEYKNQYYLTNNSYENIFLSKNLTLENKENEREIGIFDEINFREFYNLNGLTDKEKIREFITNLITQKMLEKNLIVDIDYKIVNLNSAIEFLSNVRTYDEEDLKFVKVRIETMKRQGVKDIKFINYVYQNFNQIIDLSKIKISPVSINKNSLSEIKDAIISETEKIFNELKINFNELNLNNLDEIASLLNSSAKQGILKISSNNVNLINQANITFINTSTLNINEVISVDLSKIKIDNLIISETDFYRIQNKIINFVRNELANYGLIYNSDYIIKDINSPVVLHNLVAKENSLNSCVFTVSGISSFAINEISFKVENYIETLSENEKEKWNKLIDDFNNNNNNNGNSNEIIPDEIDRNSLIDLSKISFNELVLYENNSAKLYQKITEYIENELAKLNIDKNSYIIKNNQINNVINLLLQNVNIENISILTIYANYGYSIKNTFLTIKNTPLKAVEKEEIIIKDKNNKIENQKEKEQNNKKEINTRNAIISSIVSIILLFLTIGLIYFFRIRYLKRKIKG